MVASVASSRLLLTTIYYLKLYSPSKSFARNNLREKSRAIVTAVATNGNDFKQPNVVASAAAECKRSTKNIASVFFFRSALKRIMVNIMSRVKKARPKKADTSTRGRCGQVLSMNKVAAPPLRAITLPERIKVRNKPKPKPSAMDEDR